MSLDIILIMIFVAFLHASWNIIIKGGKNKEFESGLNVIGGGLSIACVLPLVPMPHSSSWIYMLASVFFQTLSFLGISASYRLADMTYAYTVMRGTAPLFVAFGMLFLGESITMMGWIGILCICAGVLALTSQNFLSKNFNRWGTLVSLGTGVLICCYMIIDGFGVQLSENPISYVCWLFLLNACPLNIILISRHGKEYLHYARQRWITGLVGGLCSVCAYGVALWAMTRAPIELIAALRSLSVVVGMLMAVFFLHEHFTLPRFLAVVLVTAGTIVLRLA